MNRNILQNGTILQEKYQIEKVISWGGNGIVYLAKEIEKNKLVAIKECFPCGAKREGKKMILDSDNTKQIYAGIENILYENMILKELNSVSGIPCVYQSFVENNTIYIVEEYINGMSYKYYIESRGIVSFKEALYIFISVLNILEQLHNRNILHGDVNCSNILICKDGEIKLIDFGASCYLNIERESKHRNIISGFSAPEKYINKGILDKSTDLFGLAAVTYYALTGKKLSLDMCVMPQLIQNNFEKMKISKKFSFILIKMLSFNQQDRYEDVKEIKNNLEMLSNGNFKKSNVCNRNVYLSKICIYIIIIFMLEIIIVNGILLLYI